MNFEKKLIKSIFGPFFGQTRIFPKNWAVSHLSKISEKSNEPMSQFREKLVTDGRTDSTEFIGPCGYAGGPIINYKMNYKK